MSLILTPEKMTFEHQQKFKHVKLTNFTKVNGQSRPIMFKIKTNKIDLVDAKPSCGYISGKPGNNEISVTIRWLNNTGDNSAKLQILYVTNDRITEEMVARNYTHFDNDEYNQNYQAIKTTNQADVMTTILPVVRKLSEQVQPAPQPEPNPQQNSQSNIFQSVKQELDPSQIGRKTIISSPAVKPEAKKQSNQPSGLSTSKFIIFVIAAFLVGLLAGFVLGKGSLKRDHNFVPAFSQQEPQETESFSKVEAQQGAQTSSNTGGKVAGLEMTFEDLNEFVSPDESTDESQSSEVEVQRGPNTSAEAAPSHEETLTNTKEETL